MKTKVRLGVNLDHVATLRQVRGGTTPYPNIIQFVQSVVSAGADQITIHLREDRRHIQDADIPKIIKTSKVPVNLEMAVTQEMLKIALKHRPDYVCFVPEKRQELTTEGGLNVLDLQNKMSTIIKKLKTKNIKSTTFIEPSLEQVKASYQVGAVGVEFHTGKWVHLKGSEKMLEWKRLVKASEFASSLGLQVHAGHGLDYKTTYELLRLPHLEEVNIGHFLICESLNVGMNQAVRKMKKVLSGHKP